MRYVACVILLATQEETPQQAFNKIQTAIVESSAFSVRVIATEEARKYEATVLLACTKSNKLRLEFRQTMDGQSQESLTISDGGTLITVIASAHRDRMQCPSNLSKSQTAALCRLGFLPSFWLSLQLAELTKKEGRQLDFSAMLECEDFKFVSQKDGQRDIKYTVSCVESNRGVEGVRNKFEVVISYDPKTYLPTKRTISELGAKGRQGREYCEIYAEWTLGDKVDTRLFSLPK